MRGNLRNNKPAPILRDSPLPAKKSERGQAPAAIVFVVAAIFFCALGCVGYIYLLSVCESVP